MWRAGRSVLALALSGTRILLTRRRPSAIVMAGAETGGGGGGGDDLVLAELVPDLEDSLRQAGKLTLPDPADLHYYRNFEEFAAPLRAATERVQRLLDACHPLARRPGELLKPAWVETEAASAPAGTAVASAELAEECQRYAVALIDDILERCDGALAAADTADAASAPSRPWSTPLMDSMAGRGPAYTTRAGGGSKWQLAPGRGAELAVRPQDLFDPPVDNNDANWRPPQPHTAALEVLDEYRPAWQLTAGTMAQALAQDAAATAAAAAGHPLAAELSALRYETWQLEAPEPRAPHPLEGTSATWVDSPAALADMVAALAGARHVAIDLEHHSYRSFQGFTCLMQLSTHDRDWVVDALALRAQLGPALARLCADPAVVKVLHGADRDVLWLQCDFGLYLVNMFDTGQAARVLGYPSPSLAYLLQRFCGVVADKRHQLADWRVRPLSAEQVAYARADTHYLLYMHDALKRELAAAGEVLPAPRYAVALREGAVEHGALGVVLERSRLLCLSLYCPPSSHEGAALEAAQRWGLALPPAALSVLRALWVWRDVLARQLDESAGYVLPKAQLIGLARMSPVTPGDVRRCLGRYGAPLALEHAADLAAVIQRAKVQPHHVLPLQQSPGSAPVLATGAQLEGASSSGGPVAAAGESAASTAPAFVARPVAPLLQKRVAASRGGIGSLVRPRGLVTGAAMASQSMPVRAGPITSPALSPLPHAVAMEAVAAEGAAAAGAAEGSQLDHTRALGEVPAPLPALGGQRPSSTVAGFAPRPPHPAPGRRSGSLAGLLGGGSQHSNRIGSQARQGKGYGPASSEQLTVARLAASLALPFPQLVAETGSAPDCSMETGSGAGDACAVLPDPVAAAAPQVKDGSIGMPPARVTGSDVRAVVDGMRAAAAASQPHSFMDIQAVGASADPCVGPNHHSGDVDRAGPDAVFVSLSDAYPVQRSRRQRQQCSAAGMTSTGMPATGTARGAPLHAAADAHAQVASALAEAGLTDEDESDVGGSSEDGGALATHGRNSARAASGEAVPNKRARQGQAGGPIVAGRPSAVEPELNSTLAVGQGHQGAVQQQAHAEHGRLGLNTGSHGRGRGMRARQAAEAAARSSLAAAQAGRQHAAPVPPHPYAIPDEHLIKPGKRAAVNPRSGNRTATFGNGT